MKIKKLRNCNSNSSIDLTKSPACETIHCPMHVSLAVLRKLQGISSLVVGMPECCMYSRNVVRNQDSSDLEYTYILDGNEVVFGCEKGLRTALKTMKEDGAKAIFILKTCIPSLIGEDIERVGDEMMEELEIPICVADFAHFKRNGADAGFPMTYQNIVSFMKHQEKAPVITILGGIYGEEMRKLKEALEQSFEINCFEFKKSTKKDDLMDWSLLSASTGIIVTSLEYLSMARELEKQHQIPYIDFASATSEEEIKKAYEKINDIYGIQLYAEKSMTQEKAMDQEKSMDQENSPQACHYVVATVKLDSILFATILINFNYVPLFLHVEELDDIHLAMSKKLGKYDVDAGYVIDNSYPTYGAAELVIDSKTSTEGLGNINRSLKMIGYERNRIVMEWVRKQKGEINATL